MGTPSLAVNVADYFSVVRSPMVLQQPILATRTINSRSPHPANQALHFARDILLTLCWRRAPGSASHRIL